MLDKNAARFSKFYGNVISKQELYLQKIYHSSVKDRIKTLSEIQVFTTFMF